jgi:AcrR family transcriptional regulator
MKKFYIPRRDSIILTAIDIINELGIHELSTREIARRQGVSDASLYRHFSSKQDILLEVLDYYSAFDTRIIKSVEENSINAKEGILQFFRSYAEYYENYPAITAIGLVHSVLLYEEATAIKFEQILKTRSDFIERLIREGQAEGSISREVDHSSVCEVLLGTFNEITLRWRIEKHSFSLKDRTLTIVQGILGRI